MEVDYEMRLDRNPFFKIKSGEQIFEGRLFDDKRRLFETGKCIRFFLRPKEKEFFDVRIFELKKYNSFREMFFDLGGGVFGRLEDYGVEDFVASYRKHYSEKKEKEFGVLGIRMEVLL